MANEEYPMLNIEFIVDHNINNLKEKSQEKIGLDNLLKIAG